MDTQNKTLTIKRTFNTPLDMVWGAWSKPTQIAKWWNPTGGETKIIEHNFSTNGNWKFAMLMPNGSEFIAEGNYIDIIPQEKITSKANFKPRTEGILIEVLLKEFGNKTDFTFNIIHQTEAYKIQQEEMGVLKGWNFVFDRLEKVITA